MLSCERASSLSSERLDRSLTVRERLALGFHLAMCTLCRRFARQLAFMRVAGMKLREEGRPGVRLDAEAKERIRRRIAADL